MLLLLLHAEAAGHADRARAAVGAHTPLGRGDHRVPADLPPHAGHGRRQEERPDPLPEDRRERRGELVAEHRRETGGGGVAAAAGDQPGHRDQGLRLAGERPGGDRGAGRGGRAGESAARRGASATNIIHILLQFEFHENFSRHPSGLTETLTPTKLTELEKEKKKFKPGINLLRKQKRTKSTRFCVEHLSCRAAAADQKYLTSLFL